MKNQPIAVFDSGLGGLSVLKEIQALLPHEKIIYLADQVHVPYGSRSQDEIINFSEGIVNYFIASHAKMIVVACNTASAAALQLLRKNYPKLSFVGMEPAIKPAVENTKTGSIGVLATPTTLKGGLYTSVVDRYAQGVKIYQHQCEGLVEEVEKGNLKGQRTKDILQNALLPMIDHNIDAVVLGCTHYPFVIPLIKQIVGESVKVIDPAPAIAKQVQRVGEKLQLLNNATEKGITTYLTSGDLNVYKNILKKWNFSGIIEKVIWADNSLYIDKIL